MPDRSSHGSQLQHLRVRDCMHAGVLTCSADTPLVDVAGIMTKHRVHAVAVIDDKRRPIYILIRDVPAINWGFFGKTITLDDLMNASPDEKPV